MASHNIRIAIVAADFNKDVVDPMIRAAEDEVTASRCHVSKVVRVSGSYEISILANRLLALDGVDALVALGYIERGETMHGEVMGHVVHRTLVDLQLRHGKPIGMGIIGPGATLEQAHKRKESCARAAAKSAIRTCAALNDLIG